MTQEKGSIPSHVNKSLQRTRIARASHGFCVSSICPCMHASYTRYAASDLILFLFLSFLVGDTLLSLNRLTPEYFKLKYSCPKPTN